MTTRTTELAAQLTADASGLQAAFRKAQSDARELAKVNQEASRAAVAGNQRVADSFDLTVDKARKAAAGVAGVSQAFFALQAEGSARVLALGAAVGNFAELFGPAGALVTGVGVASSAIVALFLQAREEAKRTTLEIQNEIRSLASARDLGGLSRRQAQLFTGDDLFPLAASNASPAEKRRARGIGELGGLLGIEPRIKAAREEVQRLEKAFRDANAASAAVSAPGSLGVQIGGDTIRQARAALKELVATQQQLQQEYALTTRAVEKLTPRIVSQTATAIQQAEASKRAAAATRDDAQAKTELERSAKFLEEDMFRAAGRAIEAATRQISGLLDEQERYRKTVQETEKAELELAVTRKRRVEGLQEELDAAKQGKAAYEEFLEVREREQFIEQAVQESRDLAAKKGAILSDADITAIQERAAKTFDLRTQVDALVEAFERGQQEIGGLADGLSKAASAAAGLALAFGESGRRVSSLLGQTAQLLTNLSRARSAGIFTDADGNTQNVGLRGALSGAAGAGGMATAVSSVLGVVAAVGAVSSALSAFGAGAKQRAEELAAATKAFNDGFAGFRRRAVGEESALDEPIKKQLEEYAELIDLIRKRFGGESSARAQAEIGQVGRALDEAQARLAEDFFGSLEESINSLTGRDDLNQLIQAQQKFEENENSLLALLRAKIITEEEFAEAIEKNKTIRDLSIKAIEEETAAIAAQQQRRRERFGDDVQAREQTLAGDDRGAFKTRQETARRSALEEAQELLDLGIITEEMFFRMAKVLDQELVVALEEFDRASAAAAQRVQDDIAVRTLEAEGRTEEAAALRREIAQREELRNMTDDTVREQTRQLHIIEEAAEAVAANLEWLMSQREAARADARNRVALFDLEDLEAFNTVVDGYGSAFAKLFERFDLSELAGIDAAKEGLRAIYNELDEMTDAQILARFGMTRDELVSALLDTDSGLEGLANSLAELSDSAKAAAQATADFLESLETDYLRSQGRGEQADVRVATARRNARLKQAQDLKLGTEVLEQIEAIYQADLEDIRKRNTPEAVPLPAVDTGAADRLTGGGASARTSAERRSNTTVVGDFGGLSEVTGQSLAGLLRQVALNTSSEGAIVKALLGRAVPSLASLSLPSFPTSGAGAGGGGGLYIGAITVHVGGVSSEGMSPASAGAATARAIAQELGRLATAEVRFLGSGIA